MGAVDSERDDAQLATADEAQQRAHLSDVGDQLHPQVVRGAFGPR